MFEILIIFVFLKNIIYCKYFILSFDIMQTFMIQKHEEITKQLNKNIMYDVELYRIRSMLIHITYTIRAFYWLLILL